MWRKVSDHLPQVTVFVWCKLKRQANSDHGSLAGLCFCTRSLRYSGAYQLLILDVWSRILYHDLLFTGSQCNCSKTGVLCSVCWVNDTTRAAQFWILCRRLTIVRKIPYNNALPQPNLEKTRSWTKVVHASVVIYGQILPIQHIW